VRAGDVVVVVETAKAATEIGAPCDGVLSAMFAEVGEEIAVASALGAVGVTADDHHVDETAGGRPSAGIVTAGVGAKTRRRDTARIAASPLARRSAARLGVDLAAIVPSSPSGRIKQRDVQAAAVGRTAVGASSSAETRVAGRLNVVRQGDPAVTRVVLLHGFGADASAWRDLLPLLGDRIATAAIELPAHGHSPRAPVDRFEMLAAQVIQAFDDTVADAVHLVGHSLGAAAAVMLAAARPEQVRSLLLIAPAGLGPEIDGDFVAGLVRAAHPQSLAPWLRRMVHDPAQVPDEFVGASMLLRADPALREAQARLAETLFPDGTQGFDIGPALDTLQMPMRIVWGREDRIIPWRHALGAPGRVGLHLLHRVGHLPQFETPAEVARVLLELIGSDTR